CPLPDGVESWTVAEHAADLEAVVRRHTRAPIVVGSSFGAVCVLEMVRSTPDLVRGMVLIEPPLPESDEAPPMPESYLETFDRLRSEVDGPAAGAFFLRTVLGKEAFEAMPTRWRERSAATFASIRLDSEALMAYVPRYSELGSLEVPALLLGGGRSAPHFRATLRTLERALPRAEVEIIPSAGHMLHAESARTFARLLEAFSERLGGDPA
ncbi:MAG: alpha/beta fold hydrolase, partial [Myxococcota bacterium]